MLAIRLVAKSLVLLLSCAAISTTGQNNALGQYFRHPTKFLITITSDLENSSVSGFQTAYTMCISESSPAGPPCREAVADPASPQDRAHRPSSAVDHPIVCTRRHELKVSLTTNSCEKMPKSITAFCTASANRLTSKRLSGIVALLRLAMSDLLERALRNDTRMC